MKKILVTGGTGYIGSHTVVELVRAGYEVEILDNLVNSKVGVLDKIEQIAGVRPKFHEVDLRDGVALDEVFVGGGFDVVLHFAGLKAVAESVEQPLEYYDNNVGGTLRLLEAMRRHNVRELIFSSSATVYGEQAVPEFVETMVTGVNMTNPYGETKHVIEEMLRDLATAWSDFRVTILRYFNPVGAHESGLLGEDPNGRPNNLMPVIMKVARGELPELMIYGDDYPTADGTAVRDYIHVVDLARGHVAAVERMGDGVTIYNLGRGQGVSVREMVTAFEAASGQKLPVRMAARRAGDLAMMHANANKAAMELDWRAERGIDEAMQDTWRFISKMV